MIDNKSKGSAPRQIAFLVIAAAILMTASMACGPRPAASPTRVTSNEIPAIAIPTVPIALPVTSVPLTATSGPSDPTISAPVTAPPPTPSPTPTPDPYAEMTIDALAARHYGGGLLEITDTLETNDVFTRYEIKYPSDGLDIYGFMNVPNEGDNFPVVLMLHGYIDPEEYEIVDYTRRYADALAEAGYFVIHPNFRNYPPSDIGPNPFRIGYAIDVLNLIAVIREQSRDPLGTLRRADADNIHLWGHSMGGGVALRVLAVNNAPYLRAAVLYASMSGDEAKNAGRIRDWSNNARGVFEQNAAPETLRAISPIYHLDRIAAAVAVHHSRDDDVVPVEWSEELCATLDGLFAAGEIAHPPECYFYDLQSHTFRGDGDAVFMERVVAFFGRY